MVCQKNSGNDQQMTDNSRVVIDDHNIMENLMVIRVEVIAPEKPLLSKHLQK